MIPTVRYSNMGYGKRNQMLGLLQQVLKVKEIAKRVGCGENTVRRLKAALEAERRKAA